MAPKQHCVRRFAVLAIGRPSGNVIAILSLPLRLEKVFLKESLRVAARKFQQVPADRFGQRFGGEMASSSMLHRFLLRADQMQECAVCVCVLTSVLHSEVDAIIDTLQALYYRAIHHSSANGYVSQQVCLFWLMISKLLRAV